MFGVINNVVDDSVSQTDGEIASEEPWESGDSAILRNPRLSMINTGVSGKSSEGDTDTEGEDVSSHEVLQLLLDREAVLIGGSDSEVRILDGQTDDR